MCSTIAVTRRQDNASTPHDVAPTAPELPQPAPGLPRIVPRTKIPTNADNHLVPHFPQVGGVYLWGRSFRGDDRSVNIARFAQTTLME